MCDESRPRGGNIFVVGFPDAKNVLTLAPHPDDEALGCAGALLLLRERGVNSTMIYLTNGERLYGTPSVEIGEKRKEEARKSSLMLGCTEHIFLECPDGEVEGNRGKLYGQLHSIVVNRKPDMIIAPSPIDYHSDHIATAGLALDLSKAFQTFTLIFYEVYSTLRFNYLLDITQSAEGKKKAIMNYRTSLCEMPGLYATAALGLNAHRSMFVQKEGYYEAFYSVPKEMDRREVGAYLSYGDKRG